MYIITVAFLILKFSVTHSLGKSEGCLYLRHLSAFWSPVVGLWSWRVCSFEVLGALCTEVAIVQREDCIRGTVESAVSPGLSSAYCLVLWGYPFGGKCPFLQRLCLSPSTPFPFVGSFYSLHVCANVFLFHGYDFCNICCLSHRRVCRVANCFIGNFWWGMI